jgi:hypothetical protein
VSPGLRITNPARLLVLRAAVAAGGAAAALTSNVLHCTDDELAGAADQCLALLLQATLAALDAAGVLPDEHERRRLRIAIADYVDDAPGAPGRCRICGCTETSACVGIPIREGHFANCSWADSSQTLCTNPVCLEKAGAPVQELVS